MRTVLAAALLLPTLALAQTVQVPANQTIGYQGRLLRADGSPVNQTIAVTFRIYDGNATVQWSEQQSVTPNPQGFYAVFLGSATAFPRNLFNGDDRWLGITLGTDGELTPRQKIASVAYAIKANTVADGAVGTAQIADGAVTSSKLQPAEAWIPLTLLNGWTNYGAPQETAAFYKDAAGRVYLRGTVKNGTIGAPILRLPEDYRPRAQIGFACGTSPGDAHGFALVDSAGAVTPTAGSNTYFYLDGISFRAEQ
jgi:hypothetical protein